VDYMAIGEKIYRIFDLPSPRILLYCPVIPHSGEQVYTDCLARNKLETGSIFPFRRTSRRCQYPLLKITTLLFKGFFVGVGGAGLVS
jgi:hypothetical protein